MRLRDLDALPDDARIWVFGADPELSEELAGRFLEAVDGFLDGWAAHGVPLKGARAWKYDRFLIVGVDEASAPPSGCAIDALVAVFKKFQGDSGVRFLGNESVWFRMGDQIQRVSRAEFRALSKEGRITPDVIVFDNSVTRLADYRANRWEAPARERWHGPAFFGLS
ncbi:MAG: hypothetical protein ACR2QM_11905 [Longimicrobiales bacterium]